jgi:hypothetical protein
MYAVEMPSCGKIFLPNFVTIGAAVQATLMFRFGNLKGCSVGITEDRDL